MLRKIDCVMIRVDDIKAAMAYYTDVFDLRPVWWNDEAAGLALPETDAEIVLHRYEDIPSPVEVYYLVNDVISAVQTLVARGCQMLVEPFDIAIGKCAIIRDPFGTRLCILDMTKGPLKPGLQEREV
jgi:lactoylglutathione lyase